MSKRQAAPAVSTPPRRTQSWSTGRGDHRRTPLSFLATDAGERERAIQSMVSDISRALGEAVDELCTYSADFRSALTRALVHVLHRSMARTESVIIFNEAIPGHTVMLFKKNPPPAGWKPRVTDDGPVEEGPEVTAAGIVIEQFVSRTSNRVLVSEGDDALLVFFPVQDLRKNLRELGFYITE